MKDYPALAAELRAGAKELTAAIPDTMAGFRSLMHAAGADGALDARTKELIALAIAVAARCDGCVASHARAVLESGAERAEVAETIGVAILMGGGPSMVYGVEALRAYDQFAA
ncbi:MAG: carboxymuconolactone decarboxylase family protein [Azospirillaceae bacterium]